MVEKIGTETTVLRFVARQPKYITPYLPKNALEIARAWENTHHMPVFVWAMDHSVGSGCPNCGGGGQVYLRLAEAGPFSTPNNNYQISAWFDGDGKYGKGFYRIKETQVYPCPECGSKDQFSRLAG